MIQLRTFDEAIEHSAQFKKRHLLLGNGFSIACRPTIFTYGSLFDQADFSSAPRLPDVFKAVGTTDFEHVIKLLEDASRVVPVYSSTAGAAAKQMAAPTSRTRSRMNSSGPAAGSCRISSAMGTRTARFTP